jgi:hypothetical protein
MPDISMCQNSRCPLNRNCYRYRATPLEYIQSYFVDLEPQIDSTGQASCEFYIECDVCDQCDGVNYHYISCPSLAKLE